uniref:Clathrin light chain n=1 Tax=Cyprinus carpio TaxID=7962 RepID=A0A8C1VQ75_CYPCA
MDDFDMLSAPQGSTGNGVGADEDPAAAFLAQQESEIAGIENDEGFSILDSGEVPSSLSQDPDGGALNGDLHGESNGPSDVYVAISNADRLQAEPESLRKWREEQQERLEQLDANSRKQEAEWKENAKLELEEWHTRQNEQLEKTKVNNRYTTLFDVPGFCLKLIDFFFFFIGRAAEEAMVSELDMNSPGTEWERVARLCDFNPKSSKQAKDVSRMRSVLISLKQAPLVR